jgi:hypothetical protein
VVKNFNKGLTVKKTKKNTESKPKRNKSDKHDDYDLVVKFGPDGDFSRDGYTIDDSIDFDLIKE